MSPMSSPISRRRRVFLTGATGNWGRHVARELAARADRFDVVALVLPAQRDGAAAAELAAMANVRIVWGDLTDAAAVAACAHGSDAVLHLGAVVSPLADDHPQLAWRVNVQSARNIVRAVRAQPDPAATSVIMIGSIAQTGSRNPPHHWGRVGDPVRVSRYDEYGQSKVAAERVLIDGGLPRWVSLRQTAIFHSGLLEVRDPIVTHTPLGGVLEWVSAQDAARLAVDLCEDGVPDELWGGVYNVGGGEEWRLTNWELLTRVAGAVGVRDVRRWWERNWFATRNFHGHWFTDSDRLDALVPFRRDSVDAALARAVGAAPWHVRHAGRVPAAVVKRFAIEPLTRRPRGTMAWIAADDDARIRAFFGSRREWEAIGDWATFTPPQPDRTPRLLDHGYDESREPGRWTRADLAGAADFRGGELLSRSVTPGETATPLRWRCAAGHEFAGSPRLILTAGHWCPECVRRPEDEADQARSNRFLAQVV
jgi:nucleoside-diphosphate-sugar epimerase